MKILYLMHISWFWIRQRPHVLAEQLAQRHDVTLLHYAMYRGQHRTAEEAPPMPSALIWRLPGPLKRLHPVFETIDAWWIERQVRRAVARVQPDVVWVLHPVFERATRRLNGPRVVYDCMDDHLEFVGQGTPMLAAAERRLVARADLCLFSSQTLADRVNVRSPATRFLVVNNAVGARFMQIARARLLAPDSVSTVAISAQPTFGYFGTISHWFDWPLVFRLLEEFPSATLLLVGPMETPVPEHSRVQHLGVIAHSELPAFAARCDLLLMPFKINRLIESVDPVKLYEYIALGLPSLAPRYRESERFEPFVTLYDDADTAVAQARALLRLNAARPQPQAAQAFLEANTWEARAEQISGALAQP